MFPLETFRAVMADLDATDLRDANFGLTLLVLLFTFSRTECPCPKSWSGLGARASRYPDGAPPEPDSDDEAAAGQAVPAPRHAPVIWWFHFGYSCFSRCVLMRCAHCRVWFRCFVAFCFGAMITI